MWDDLPTSFIFTESFAFFRLLFPSLDLKVSFLGQWRSTLIIVTIAAVAKVGVALETSGMADAVILLAIVLLAIASFADSTLQSLPLLLSELLGLFSVVIVTVHALADAFLAGDPSLEADTVELPTLTSFAVATELGRILLIIIETPKIDKKNATELILSSHRSSSCCLLATATAAQASLDYWN